MSLYNSLDLPLKSPTTELLFYSNPISNLLYDLKNSEIKYRDQLSKLLACCSLLRQRAGNELTNSIRKLIAIHTELTRILDYQDDYQVGKFMNWCEESILVYDNYIKNYKITKDELDLELDLKKCPMIRIIQLKEFIQKIMGLNESNNYKLLQNYQNLINSSQLKIKSENQKLDQSIFFFNKVYSLSSTPKPSCSYFHINQIINRIFVKFDLIHPQTTISNQLIELIQLDKGIALCSIETKGRSLMFPILQQNEFEIISNDDLVHLYNDEMELKFKFDKDYNQSWNQIFENYFNLDLDSKFINKFENLENLKMGNIGLGFKLDSPKSNLRKSSPMISRHPSLNIGKSESINALDNIELFFQNEVEMELNNKPLSTKDLNIQNYEDETKDRLGSESPVLPLNIKKSNATTKLKLGNLENLENNSTISLPNFPNTNKLESLNLNDKLSGSSIDLSKFDNIKPNFKPLKKRKSLFNLFKSKNEPEFEIVNPKSQSQSQSSTNLTPRTSSSTSSSTLNENNVSQPKQSMASLQKNIKNLTISTSSQTLDSSLPSPFGKSSNIKEISLTPLEESTLSSSKILKIFKNNTIVSKWNITQWCCIGEEYNNTLKFISTSTGTKIMTLYVNSSIFPKLMIPIDGSSIVQSSALDIQLKCFNNIEETNKIMLNIRCKDIYTLKQILLEFENPVVEKLSASNSDVFSAPSNSTSMSSVSVDEIQELGKPKALGGGAGGIMKQKFGSSSSLGSTKTSIPCQTLLLKSDVKIKLHKLDEDEEWRPLSIGKFNISSNLGNPFFSKFEILLTNKFKIDSIVKNSNCERLGKSGLKFNCLNDLGDELNYLIEFRNSDECQEIYEMLI
ncbi:hypothetical protein BN7_2519 [Wickerhamomyces ciferrii]|uniref:DH domain-containing protein n=1 Tax=Wickerhamomyces ciferrii (strain ATCC 14091 / BCRC 22168 / CBS 111 / JCM 3599 / NBRC 0793 / NRRL Y-1031 F-60-10) TaxID=1206466 RepID=K0KPA9_WICCF|nr:uncharacterized protein BN7_2519 [Wickerhamomyces ciferrii]CCH42973.1 hypothetical protein BN7_2519 [Wickerhamomyces ciferrii]